MGLGKKRKASVPVGGWVERQSGLRVIACHHLLASFSSVRGSCICCFF